MFRVFSEKDKLAIARNRCYSFGFPINLSTQTMPVSFSDFVFQLYLKFFKMKFFKRFLLEIFQNEIFQTLFQ